MRGGDVLDKVFKVGLVGLGVISEMHLRALSKLPCAQIVALCDVDIEKARSVAQRFGLHEAALHENYGEMLKRTELNTVHIMTPHYLHADMAKAALKAGKYVLLEKPMDISLDNINSLIRADEARKLGIVYQNRYNAATREAKRVIESGEYGKLLALRASVAWLRDRAYYGSADWRGKWATEGGGVLINQAIHSMDLLYHFGGAFDSIKGSISTALLKDIIEAEDNAHAVIKYRDGKTALFYASANNVADEPVEIHLAFERGALRLIGNNLYRMDGEITCLLNADGKQTSGKAVYGTGHDALIRDFYECALANRPFPIGGREGYPSIWAVLSIYESMRTGDWVSYQ